eukprot:148124-Pelagomonas_calceolata.AAC.9
MGEGVADRPSRSAKAMHIPYTALFADYMDEDAAESSQEEEKEGGHTGPDVRTGVEEEEGDPPSFCTGEGKKSKIRLCPVFDFPSVVSMRKHVHEKGGRFISGFGASSLPEWIDLSLPDEQLKAAFPGFPGKAAAMEVTLKAGQMLYLPAGTVLCWFHEVTSFSPQLRKKGKGSKSAAATGAPDAACGHMAVNLWFHPPDNLKARGSVGVARPYKSDYCREDNAAMREAAKTTQTKKAACIKERLRPAYFWCPSSSPDLM